MIEEPWETHSYLKRLPPEAYRGHAVVHWSMAIDQRKQGWLNDLFHARFREVLTHTGFRYCLACPCYVLMPDHAHLLLMGYDEEGADQRRAMRYLRKQINWLLATEGFKLQKQGHDHVLREESRRQSVFQTVAGYVRENPLRAGLVTEDSLSEYRWGGCLVPGYPELDVRADGFWDSYWKIYWQLRDSE
ncbi:MAG: hypothetical protein P1U58_18550 [Verrucomicrobiales bacterium]|nr:hypothetical protein [Verrucomicrobiales bacterium]